MQLQLFMLHYTFLARDKGAFHKDSLRPTSLAEVLSERDDSTHEDHCLQSRCNCTTRITYELRWKCTQEYDSETKESVVLKSGCSQNNIGKLYLLQKLPCAEFEESGPRGHVQPQMQHDPAKSSIAIPKVHRIPASANIRGFGLLQVSLAAAYRPDFVSIFLIFLQ